jgi:SAM-dependent methyltransferase
MAAVVRALRNAYRSLLPGGLLVIRDFVRPEGADTPVTMYHQRHDIREGRSLPDFVERTFWPARLMSMAVSGPANVYATDLTSAHEFIWRKDHGGAWDYELRERYGFWSCSEASALLFRVGFSRVHADIRANRWVLANRVARRVQLRERASGRVVQPPVNQIVLFAER